MGHRLFPLPLACMLLVACGGDNVGADASTQGDDSLPKPGAVSGSVTGMPNPGTASPPRLAPQPSAVIELPNQADSLEAIGGEVGMQPPPEGAPNVGTFDPAAPDPSAEAPAGEAPAATDLPEPTPPRP